MSRRTVDRETIAMVLELEHLVLPGHRWFIRWDKSLGHQVVHDWGGDVIAEETMRVLGTFPDTASAIKARDAAERGAVVDAIFVELSKQVEPEAQEETDDRG